MGNTQYSPYSPLESQDPNETLGRLVKSASSYTNKPPKKKLSPHSDAIIGLAAIRPGLVITGSRDKSISVTNLETTEGLMRWNGHEKEVTKVAYRCANQKHFVLSGSRDTTIKLWMFNNKYTQKTYEGHTLVVTGLEVVGDNKFVSGSRDTTIRLWNAETGQTERMEQSNRNLVTHIAYHSQSHLLAQSSEDKEIKLWDSRNLDLVHQYPRKMHIQMHCDFSPDGNYILACSNGFNGDGCNVTVYDIRNHKQLHELKGHEESVTSVAFLHQQVTWKKLIVSVSMDRTARIWSIDDGVCLWKEEIPGASPLLDCVAFNDGSIAVAGDEGLLAHYRLMGKGGRPFLNCTSYMIASTDKKTLFNQPQ